MTRRQTTRCWGVAVLIGFTLPLARPIAVDQGTPVPARNPQKTPPSDPQSPRSQRTSIEPYASKWSVPISGEGSLSLTFTTSSLILAGSEIATEARSLDDGRVLWTSERHANLAPVVAGDLVIAPGDDQLVALDRATGHDVWTAGLAGTPQPLVIAGDAVLVAIDSTLIARKTADGTTIWAVNLGAKAVAAPAAGEGLVIVALDDHTLAAFDRATGNPVWREPIDVTVLAMAVFGDRVYASVAEGSACAHRLEHGRRDWCFPVRVRPIGPPVADGRNVYFAFLDNTVRVFDRRSGTRYAAPPLGSLPAAGPTLTGDYVIVPSVTGEFVLLAVQNKLDLSRVSTPRAVELPSTRAAAVASDGRALAVAITSAGGLYSLVYFGRTPTTERPTESGEATKSVDTGSDTPPAPRAP